MTNAHRIQAVAGLALCISAPAMAQVTLYDNGPFQTNDPPASCIPAGSHESLLQNNTTTGTPPGQGLTINGFGVQWAGGAGNFLADDFVVPASDPGWLISSMTFNGYMSGNSQIATSPMTGVYVRVWDGPPNAAGSHILFGDLTTNRIASTTFSGVYRHAQTACGTTRPLWYVTATTNLSLPPGTYWVEWALDGVLGTATGPFAPPVTIFGQPGKPGANALQNGAPLTDGTAPPAGVGIVPQDMPFVVKGTIGAPLTGACCMLNGSCQSLTAVGCAQNSGAYAGDGITCGNANCPQPGACCQADGTCQVLATSQCAAIDGAVYRGNGTGCASANCAATGACCQLDGSCSSVNESSCKTSNGLWRGAGSSCASASCPSSYTYPGQPLFIADATGQNGTFCGPQTVAEITVADSFPIGGADVSMFVTHTFQGDLLMWLKHVETGRMVQILNRQPDGAGGFSAHNFGSGNLSGQMFRLIDSAPSYYRTPPVASPGIDGVHWQWKPENPLAAFAGENSAGTWQLIAQDCGGPGDTGNIEYWVLSLQHGSACYPNCDHSTQPPVLNVADFSCFLTKYAAGDAYANCDNSTQPPVLNVQDFSCFLTKYAASCSAP